MKREEMADNSFGVSSVIFSSMGLVNTLAIPLVGIVLSVVGLIFGMMQKKRHPTTWSRWGIWLGIAGIVLNIIAIIIVILFAAQIAQQLGASSLGAAYG